MTVLVALPLPIILAAAAFLAITFTSPKQVSDSLNRVTVTVPGTWQEVDETDSGPPIPPDENTYAEPAIKVGGFISGDLLVHIEDNTKVVSAEGMHEDMVGYECGGGLCVDPGTPTPVTINGVRGVQQILQRPEDEATVVTTLRSKALTVTLIGYTYADTDRMLKVVGSTVIAR